MSNAFMASAQKSKREQDAAIKKKEGGSAGELRVISIRIPAELHHKALVHRIETGESVTKLVIRLLAKELG